MTLFPKSYTTVRALVTAYPRSTLLVTVCLLLGGLSEGLGIGAMLPLLKTLLGGGQDPRETWLGRSIENLVSTVGLAPTPGVLLGLIAVLLMVKAFLVLLSVRQAGFTAAAVETDLRLSLVRSLMKAKWGYFLEQASGRLSHALTTEAVYASYCYDLVCRIIAELAQLTAYMGVALLISWQITLVGIAAAILSAAGLSKFMGISRRAGETQTRLLNAVSARIVDALGGIKPLKAMACEERLGPLIEADIKTLNQARRSQVFSLGVVRSMIEPFFAIVLGLGAYVGLVVMRLELEVVMVLMLLFWRGLLRMGALQANYQELVRYESSYWSLKGAIKDAEESAEPSGGDKDPTLNTGLTFDDVSFSYGDKAVLKGANLNIPAGRATAIVGPSGVGKTTIADMLAGLVEPQSGRILVDGTPLSELDRGKWRRMLGYAPQETVLFHDSILSNVTLGDPQLSRQDAEEALRMAGAWEFVADLPQGIDTIVGERGGKFSGGQRQRFSLARALVRKPCMLILDEITAGLDPHTERAIAETVRNLKGKVTVLIISHQAALVDAADSVYSLDGLNAEIHAVRCELEE